MKNFEKKEQSGEHETSEGQKTGSQTKRLKWQEMIPRCVLVSG